MESLLKEIMGQQTGGKRKKGGIFSFFGETLYVVKLSLGSVNNLLADVEYNGSILKEGMNRVARCMNTFKSETSKKNELV
jgi:hypothetical protein